MYDVFFFYLSISLQINDVLPVTNFLKPTTNTKTIFIWDC